MAHRLETQERIKKAREHYETRTSRRPKGQSRSDLSIYTPAGIRMSPLVTLAIRQREVRMNAMPDIQVETHTEEMSS